MDRIGSNQIPKIVKVLSHRSGRYFFEPNDPFPTASMMETRSVIGQSFSQDNPMVVTSVAAGVLGVILVIVIIFSVWIRRRCYGAEDFHHSYSSRSGSTNATLSSSSFVYTIPRVHSTSIVLSPVKEETTSTSSGDSPSGTLREMEVV